MLDFHNLVTQKQSYLNDVFTIKLMMCEQLKRPQYLTNILKANGTTMYNLSY